MTLTAVKYWLILLGVSAGLVPQEAIAKPASAINQQDFNQVCQVAGAPANPNQLPYSQTLPYPLVSPSPRTVLARPKEPWYPQEPGDLLMPYSVNDYFNLGREQAQAKNYTAAIAAYSQALKLNPYDIYLYEARAEAYEDLGNLNAAAADYSRAIEQAPPGSTFGRERRIRLRKELKDWQGMEEDLSFLIDKKQAKASYLYRDRCIARAALGNRQGAIADYREYRKQVPIPKPSSNLVSVPLLKPSRVLVLPPPPPVQVKAPSSRWPTSTALPIPTPEPEPTTTRGYFERGLRRMMDFQNNWQGAFLDFRKVTEKEPTFAAAYYYMGIVSAKSGEYEVAINSFSDALAQDPEFDIAHYSRGVVYSRLKDPASKRQAIADFDLFLQRQPIDKKAKAMYSAAQLYLANDRVIAQKHLDDMIWELKLTPTEAYLQRATALELLNMPTRAIAEYTRVIEMNPESSTAYYRRGQLRARQGDCQGGRTDQQRAAILEQQAYQQQLAAYKQRDPGTLVYLAPPPLPMPLSSCDAPAKLLPAEPLPTLPAKPDR